MQFQQHIYLEDYRRHLVAVSQRSNDHMQVDIYDGEQIELFHIK